MFTSIGIKETLILVGITALFTALIMKLVIKIAFHINALDIPNERKVHTKPMPRLGGLGIFLGFLFTIVVLGIRGSQLTAILISGFLIIILGILDDVKPLEAKYKLIGQILASLVLMFYGNIYLKDVTIFGLYINLGWSMYIVTPIFIVAIINAMNLIDGLDGLMAGTSSIFFITVCTISLLTPKLGSFSLILSSIMLGAALGFLVHNFHPAKIFAGDSGSMFIGLMISVVSLLGFKTATATALIVPIIILGIPILDTICAIIRRIVKHQPVFLPDKLHLHHQLLSLGLSHKNTVLAIYFMNSLFALASIVYFSNNQTMGKYIYVIILLLVVWLVTRTSIIKDKKKK